jgi:succinate-semialdehyde dehydrogenase/glutarate-semialdehyde dehydrogenase
MIITKNPYNGRTLKEYYAHTDSQVEHMLEKAQIRFLKWRDIPISERTKALKNMAQLLRGRIKHYAELITTEMGKPITQSLAEVEKCAWVCDFYAKNAEAFLADQLIETDADESFISFDPMGVILAIMPWNFPFWQVVRFAAPTLTAGNTVLLKHAKNVPGCAVALEELFLDAGFPKGCFQTVLTDHQSVDSMIADSRIKGVTLTGSEKAGKSIAQAAAKNLKKTVLELGGNNACIIWEDADLEKHIDTLVMARMQNTGQSCIAAKRFIVVDEIYNAFIDLFRKKLGSLQSGDPMKEATEIGVVARLDLVQTLERQINDSIKKGAQVTLGNKVEGYYFTPTILEKVTPGMPVFDEEVFGPVAAIVRAKDREDALWLATQSDFGLGTMLFTEDIDAARRMIGSIPDGAYFVNEMVKSDPRLPFGGTKRSGYGRELSREGILEFVNKKTVFIKK